MLTPLVTSQKSGASNSKQETQFTELDFAHVRIFASLLFLF